MLDLNRMSLTLADLKNDIQTAAGMLDDAARLASDDFEQFAKARRRVAIARSMLIEIATEMKRAVVKRAVVKRGE